MSNDQVNSPSHYSKGRTFEPIDVIEDWELSFHLGNAIKYIARAGRKDPALTRQDISKAIWYLERFSDQLMEAESQANDADQLLADKNEMNDMGWNEGLHLVDDLNKDLERFSEQEIVETFCKMGVWFGVRKDGTYVRV